MSVVGGRGGATFSDILVFVATLSLAAALLYPAWSAREFRGTVSTATADVEAVGAAARRTLMQSGRWPAPAMPGVAPPELTGLTGEGTPFSRVGYRVAWTSWNVVDSVEALPPPPAPGDTPPELVARTLAPVVRSIGGVAVHSGDARLLAELSERFAGASTFVLDTMWLLVLPDRGDAPVGP